jgi:hypothetical protein
MARDSVSGIVLGAETVEWAVARVGQTAPEASGAEALPTVAVLPAPTDQEPAPQETTEASIEETPAGPSRQDVLRRVCGGLRGAVSVGLPSDQLLLRVALLPADNTDELAGMVQLQVDKWSPFPVDTMAVSHDVLAKREGGYLVLMAAVREETAAACYRELEAAGARPARMDLRVLGRWRTLKDAGEILEQGRQVIVLLGDGKPELLVAQDGLPLVIRVLDIPDTASAGEWIEELLREAAHTLLSIEIEHGVAPVAGVWIGAPGNPDAALGSAFQQEYPSATVSLRDLGHLPTAVAGVALRFADQPEGGIDLVPAEFRRKGTERAFRRRLIGTAVGVACFWVVTMAGVFGLLAYEQLTLSGLQSERDYWMTPAKEVGVVKRRVAVIRLYMDQTYSALECLREIGERKPDGVFLNAMTYKKGEAIRLNGEADSADIVYTLKSNLTASPLFKNAEATLVGPNHDPRKNKYTFELRLSLPDTSGGAS